MKETVLWSNHAIARAAEYRFTAAVLFEAWNAAVENYLSKEQQNYKFQRYGMKSLSDRFFWSEKFSILFTVSVSKSGQWFIQTVTNRRGNWSK